MSVFNYLLLHHLVENSYCIGYLNRLAIVEEENKNNSVCCVIIIHGILMMS
ncbi:MAG: hypothetical protein P8I98_08065 [Nitrospinaceae bacterium]|nr:hypothetical protein [Nitrospinaceae bacterium]